MKELLEQSSALPPTAASSTSLGDGVVPPLDGKAPPSAGGESAEQQQHPPAEPSNSSSNKPQSEQSRERRSKDRNKQQRQSALRVASGPGAAGATSACLAQAGGVASVALMMHEEGLAPVPWAPNQQQVALSGAPPVVPPSISPPPGAAPAADKRSIRAKLKKRLSGGVVSQDGDIVSSSSARTTPDQLQEEQKVFSPSNGEGVGTVSFELASEPDTDTNVDADAEEPRSDFLLRKSKKGSILARLAPMRRSLSERLKKLEERHVSRLHEEMLKKEQEIRQQQFDMLPDSEALALSKAFQQFDRDNGGSLDRKELRLCLAEMGLAGTCASEKKEVTAVCSEQSEYNLHSFALQVVPKVRERLTDLRSNEMLRHFFVVDTEGNGLLSVHQTTEVARMFGIDQRMVIAAKEEMLLISEALEVGTKAGQAKAGAYASSQAGQRGSTFGGAKGGRGRRGQSMRGRGGRGNGADAEVDPAELAKQAAEQAWKREHEETIDFDCFQALISKGREGLDRKVRDREREVQRQRCIDESVFQEFRQDLVGLHNIFIRYDKDDSGTLDHSEVMIMIKEFGLLPRTQEEREEVKKVLNEADRDKTGEFDFLEFLVLIRMVRAYRQGKKQGEQWVMFQKYDKDGSGVLSIKEISALLTDLGNVPTTPMEQTELGALIELCDKDGSAQIDFWEFQVLCQRIDEKLKSMRYELDVEFALRLGFTEEQMRDLRFVFDSLDEDGGNSLDLSEIKNACTLLKKNVPPEVFEDVFEKLDEDNSGSLDFQEFLEFMKIVRDGDGAFAEEAGKLQQKVVQLEVRLLRNILEKFKLSKMYVDSLTKDELVDLFCDFFSVTPNSDLKESLGVKTVGDLLELAVQLEKKST